MTKYFSACFLFLSACTPAVQVNHEVPQLDALSQGVKKLVVENCGPKPRPTLAMPPIPQNCIIDIRGNSMTASSPECEDLIRFYVKARTILKP